MKFFGNILGAALLWASATSSSPIKYCPSTGVCYSVGIPSTTASAGSGDIYVQISAPSSGYSWAGIGIGGQMAGATIFVMYADGTGNVTISARNGGGGHVLPLSSPPDQAKTTLLAGSGISGGVMTANFKYSVSSSILKVASTSTNWISAWRTGDSIGSTSISAVIEQHDIGSSPTYAKFTLDLTKASISTDSNPFVSSSSTPTGGSNSTSPGSDSDSGSGVTVVSTSGITNFQTAHGVIMASSMVVLFPMGAIILRVFGGVWLHASIQVFTLCAIIAGFGLGIHLAKLKSELFSQTHTTLGTVVVCLFLLQPFIGLLHHRQYQRIGKRSYFGHVHIWYGRILIILGVINGGLGLQLAQNSKNGEIAYGAVAGAIFLLYVVVMVVVGVRKERAIKHG